MDEDKYYFCVGVDEDIAPSGKIYFYARTVQFSGAGDMVAYGDGLYPNLSIAAGKWKYLHSASMIAGGCCKNIEHWN